MSCAYDTRDVLRQVSLAVRRGERVALAGPNGSGKTTLLRALSGAIRPREGTVTVDGRSLTRMKPRERARRIGVVGQHVDPTLGFTVREIVAMGRAPYLSPFGTLSRNDQSTIDRSLEAVEATPLARRHFSELSGGEQQRVMIALALAQETDFLLLDEPTVHLDLHHQHEVLELLTRLQSERMLGLLAVMHDLNLAALYFDRLAVLRGGSLVAQGSPDDVLSQADVLAVFDAPLTVISHPRAHVPQVLLDRSP